MLQATLYHRKSLLIGIKREPRMELFRRNSIVRMFVIIKGDVIHAYLGYNIVDIQKQLMETASLIMKMSDSTNCINKQFYAQEAIMFTISVKKFLTVLMVTCY
jgi:hypothetical protein